MDRVNRVPEDPLSDMMRMLSVRELENLRETNKPTKVIANKVLPMWIGVAPANADADALAALPAHIKPSLGEALEAFQRFRVAHPGRILEIRLKGNEQYATIHYPRVIGGGDYRGLQLDGLDRWEGLRIVTPEVDVMYGEGSRYSVVVREGVTSIGEYAFWKCSGLTSVTFPEGLTSIEEFAFCECSGLTSVVLPAGLTSIGGSAFWKCSGLTSVTFPEGLTSIGASAFSRCSGLTSVVLPAGLTSIGESAFYECTGLTSVTFPEGLASIGMSSFSDCTGLTSVTFPEGLTSIGGDAFRDCTGLTSVTFPEEGLSSIGAYAFFGCTRLTSVRLSEKTELGYSAFGSNVRVKFFEDDSDEDEDMGVGGNKRAFEDDSDDDEGAAASAKRRRMRLWEKKLRMRLEGADKYGALRL